MNYCLTMLQGAAAAQHLPETQQALWALAFALGAQHGLDADHLATIDGLARRAAAKRPGAARASGLLFSTGHGLVVVCAASAAALAASRWQIPGWLPISGVAISVAFLFGLAVLNLRALVVTPGHRPVLPTGLKARAFARLAGLSHPIAMVAVGGLFALAFDAISQAAFFALLAGGGPAQTLAAACCFVLGMMVVDGANGWSVASMARLADSRALVSSRIMTGAIALTSLAVGCLALAAFAWPEAISITEAGGALLSASTMAAIAIAFAIAMRAGRAPASSA